METTSAKTEARKQEFKKGISHDANRRRREEVSIRLRKEKKDECLAKRRNIGGFASTQQEESGNQAVTASNGMAEVSTQDLQQLFQMLHLPQMEQVIEAVRGFRKALSVEKNPPVQKCVELGVLPILVSCLYREDKQELQFEASWAITNIASTEFTRVVVEHNAVPPLVQLLTSSSADIREQCAWALGNIAGDSSDLRDLVLAQNPLPALLANIDAPASLSLLRNCAWTLSNFCRGKPAPKFESVASALPCLAKLIGSNMDKDSAVDACWALSYMSDGDENRIQRVVELGVAERLVQLLTEGGSMLVPSLRTLGNFVTGNEQQTQIAINAGILPALCPLLSHNRKNVRKESLWVLSNIAAGSAAQLRMLCSTPDLLARVLAQLCANVEWDCRKEAAWVVSNIATSASREMVVRLVECGALPLLCELLDVSEAKIILISLDAIEAILKVGETVGDGSAFVNLVTDCGGAELLERLQTHENTKVYKRVVSIIERFFGVEEEEMDQGENIAPAADGNVFSFGIQNNSDNNNLMKFQQGNNNTFSFGNSQPFAFGQQPSQHIRFGFSM
jgi:hypothetical protein